ncbi:MAG: 1-(5-phosphoribosyl)-5-[(5-phosphoribosylamino)methylideneamino]imidazole-4-carboxamide isomerase [Bacteroidales bacterium]
MRIIAAIDILGGKCVRLTRGDFSAETIYNKDPLEAAKMMEYNGIKYLHLVDLDGAKSKMIVNYRILEKIASKTSLEVDFGGGIRSDNDLRIAFGSGARQVTAGSVALSSPSLVQDWLIKYGNEKIILGADSKGGKIAIDGWQQESDTDVIPFISEYCSKGMKYAICTDVDKDGLLKGPAIDLYRGILSSVKVHLIASGGISSINDIIEIKEAGCEGAIIGKAIYEGKIKLKELRDLC